MKSVQIVASTALALFAGCVSEPTELADLDPQPLAINAAWELDRFDELALGLLHGQNGWVAVSASATVAPAVVGREAVIDPPAGQTTVMTKDVPDQTSGRHRLELAVRVDQPSAASMAKLEVRNGATSGWNKLVQIFAGTGIRVNYDPSGASVVAVGAVQAGRTYRLRIDLDLGTGRFDVAVDGQVVATGLQMAQATRRIAELGLSGWDQPGRVVLDDIVGQPIAAAPPPTVQITGPAAGATVAGTVPFTASASSNVAYVDFLVDGITIARDAAPPFEVPWSTLLNPLPAPNHAMDFGYYFVEWKDPATFATARAETNDYTSTYYATLATYVSDFPQQWPALLDQSLRTAVAEGRRIHLNLELQSSFFAPYAGMVLDIARPYWSSIVRLELADEPGWSLEQTNAQIAQVDQALAARGLARPPGGLGATYVYNQALPPAVAAPGLTWIGIEAYIDAPGSGDSLVDIDNLRTRVGAQLAQVPAGKQIVLVPMAYDRNGVWTNYDTLRDLQVPMYLLAHADPRVIAINMFSYTRPGGSRDRAMLRTPHRLIAERIFARPIARAGDGPRSLRVRAVTAEGAEATHAIVVQVANSGPPTIVPWEDDTFDLLAPGPLAGQNGWIATGASPMVSSGVLVVDAQGGQTIQVEKDVADQTSGRHRVTLRVRAAGVADASVAKLEIKSNPATGWDKLCQIFVGTHIRVNYDPSGAAAIVVPATDPTRWYQLRLDFDLATARVDVYVDGVLAASQLPVRAGPITRLHIVGWDRAGQIQVDDLRGTPIP